MWLLFVPLLIVFALLFMVGSLVAGLFGLLGHVWPVLLIGLGIWLFWHEDGRHRRGGHHHRRRWAGDDAFTGAAWPSSGMSDQPDKATRADKREQADKADRQAAERRQARQTELPVDVQVRVDQIRRKVDALLARADRFPPFSQDLYLVRQTASDYLPRTINAYLAMPRQTAERSMGSDGKTAHQELKAQLDLLDSRLDDIGRDLERQDADRLLANRRFLEDRFAMRQQHDPKLDPMVEPRSDVAGVA